MPLDPELELTSEIAAFVRNRFFGKYRGIVTDIADPEAIGRIRAQVPAVLGQEATPWAMPAVPFAGDSHGLVLLPEVGDGVWIEFEAGNPSLPIWTGCFWARGQRPSPQGDTIRLLATSSGHQLVLDEQADEIKLVHPGGATVVLGRSEIKISLGTCEIKMTTSEINLNHGMVKVTTAGASLVNDAFKVGA